MNAAGHYRQLVQLGRDEFLASAAPAALVRLRPSRPPAVGSGATITIDDDQTADDDYDAIDETLPSSKLDLHDVVELEVYPLIKKPGASFPDRITIGRTSNNDVVIADTSVSRLHAYVRRIGDVWCIADAGSKNGTSLRGEPLEPRRERALPSRALLKIGDVELTFYVAADLYGALGGTS
jgi:hypothetical protein